MPDALVDASYLVALAYTRDRYHERAKSYAAAQTTPLIVPDVVLTEAVYNIQRLGGTAAAIRFGHYYSSQCQG